MKSKQLSHSFEVPLNADPVEAPIVQYGGGITAIHFKTEDEHWGRVTFEGLDSIKISRGEYEPYPPAPGEKNLLIGQKPFQIHNGSGSGMNTKNDIMVTPAISAETLMRWEESFRITNTCRGLTTY